MNFIMGADVSSLQAMEDQGAKFYDLDGMEREALSILSAHGVNCIRLRLFNRPTESFDGGDYCDLWHTLVMAERVKKQGMGLLLDFHYSDFWADWKKQNIPLDWEDQSAEKLEQSVYTFTKSVLQEFERCGAIPDIVQIGNEIGKGLLWDYGCLEYPGQIAAFLNAGFRAVNEINQEGYSIKTMLHLECGADTIRTEQFFDLLFQNGLDDFDYVGLSYYPYWSGPYHELANNMKNIWKRFHKRVMVVETAFPYTDESNDEMPNVVTGELTQETMKLTPSVENQCQVLEKIIDTVRAQENGCGVFYWEPTWYKIKGVGVARGKGNEWENQAMFDVSGQVLESIRVFEH